MLRAVQDLVLAFAAGSAGHAVDAVEAIVLSDPAGVVQGRFPRGGRTVVLRALDRPRGAVPGDRIAAGRILEPGGDDHRSSRVHALSGRRAHHGGALLAGRAIIVLLAAGLAGRWLVLRRQHVRQHRPFFLHLGHGKQTRRKFSTIAVEDRRESLTG